MSIQYRYRLSIQLKGKKHEMEIAAHSEAQAVSMYYKEFKENKTQILFPVFKELVKCENLGLDNLEQFYVKEANFIRMCKYRKIEFARMGMRVQIAGRMATIVGNHKSDLLVIYDGFSYASKADPRWQIVYFDEAGAIIKDFRKGKGEFTVCIPS